MKKTALLCLATLCAGTIAAQSMLEGTLTDVRPLTSDRELRFENPQWSPDGQLVAFTKQGYDGIYVINADGSGLRTLSTDLGVGYRYQWSYDSREILMRDTRYEKGAIGEPERRLHALWSVDLEGKKVRMSDDSEYMQPAVWNYSTTGQKRLIAPGAKVSDSMVDTRVSERATAGQLAPMYRKNLVTDTDNLYLVDGNGNAQIIYNGCALAPALSPNGKLVAFVTEFDEIMVMNVDGSDLRKVASGFRPTWAGNAQLLYERTTDDGHEYTSGEIYLLTLATGQEVQLTNTPDRIEMYPVVSADGKRIAFCDFKEGQIYIANIK